MDFTVSLLLGTFLLSVAALFAFIWSMSKGLFGDGTAAATQIFALHVSGGWCVLHPRGGLASARLARRADLVH